MNKERKDSKARKVAATGIAVSFLFVIAAVGSYAIQQQNRQKEDQASKVVREKVEAETEKETPEELEELEEQQQESLEERRETTMETEESVSTGQVVESGNFTEDSILLWPVDGNVILDYSMDQTVYFATLDQYKYNPAMIISGAEGDQVICGAKGIVKSIDVTAQTGTTVTIDVGNGYELLYGQLKDVPVKAGEGVEAKTVLGYVNAPTRYYAVEGSNVYFQMKKEGQPVNPMDYMQEDAF